MMRGRGLGSSESQLPLYLVSRPHELLGNVISGPSLRGRAGKAFQESQEVFANSRWQNALKVFESGPSQVRIICMQCLKGNMKRLATQTQRQESENVLKANVGRIP